MEPPRAAVKPLTHRVRFLFPSKVQIRYTRGSCAVFASTVAQCLGGRVVGINSPEWEHVRIRPGRPDCYLNPLHQVAEVRFVPRLRPFGAAGRAATRPLPGIARYVDVTGVYASRAAMVAYWRTLIEEEYNQGRPISVYLTYEAQAPIFERLGPALLRYPRLISRADLDPGPFKVRFVYPGQERMNPLAFAVALLLRLGGVVFWVLPPAIAAEEGWRPGRDPPAPLPLCGLSVRRVLVTYLGTFASSRELLLYAGGGRELALRRARDPAAGVTAKALSRAKAVTDLIEDELLV